MKLERGAGTDVIHRMHSCLDKAQDGAAVVSTLSVTTEGRMLRTNVLTFTHHKPDCRKVSR